MDRLPDDPKLLKNILRTLVEDNQKLEQELSVLKRMLFGKKSERIVSEQLLMPFELTPPPSPTPEPPPAAEGASDAATAPTGPPKRKNGHGRRPLPSHLERKRIECDLPEAEKTCPHCHEKWSDLSGSPRR